MEELITAIRIKGLRDGLLVVLPEGTWVEQSSALLTQIDGQRAFFQGARLALDVGSQVMKVNEMVELRDRLSERSVSLWAVISESPLTEKTAQLLGLATRVSKPRPEELPSGAPAGHRDDAAILVHKTLRSGTRIEFANNVVILGDVNPGAEVVAVGSVVVWGRLRGAVHAGSAGDASSVICALELMPMRLQIASQTLDLAGRKETGKPEMAVLREQSLVIEAWQPGNAGQT